MSDPLRIVTFASTPQVATYNTDSIPRHLYKHTFSSSMTSVKQRSCTQSIKNILFRFYDFLARWIPCLPKREQPRRVAIVTPDPVENPRLAEGIQRIDQNPEYQRDPKGYIWKLLRDNGHYRYHTGDEVLNYFLAAHNFIAFDGAHVLESNHGKEIDEVMEKIEQSPEYQTDPIKYLNEQDALIEDRSCVIKSPFANTRPNIFICAIKELKAQRSSSPVLEPTPLIIFYRNNGP